MRLLKPLVIFDIESAVPGLAPDAAVDKIVHMAACKFAAGLDFEPGNIVPTDRRFWMFNPGFEMSKENVEIHGITNEMASGYPMLDKTLGNGITDFFAGCDIGGFNCTGYDIPLLWEELYRVGIVFETAGRKVFDAGNIFKKKEERTLSAAVKFFVGNAHDSAHNASGDVNATAEVLAHELARYSELAAMTPDQLHDFCDMSKSIDLHGTIRRNDKGEPVFGTKRNRGVRVVDDPGYAMWMLRSDFPANTKLVIRQILDVENGDQNESLL